MSLLTVPVVAVVTGEGSSGGALALGVANCVLMMENAIYSILSPEGFASILWKDSSRSAEACELMKLTAQDLLRFGMIDGIVPEPLGGAQREPTARVSRPGWNAQRSFIPAAKAGRRSFKRATV